MQTKITKEWLFYLNKITKTFFFKELIKIVSFEYENKTCYPPQDLIFEAFNQCLPADLKVVIIGQDPYHGENEANGLAFSVHDGVKIPPSLRNIFKEINLDFDTVFLPTTGNLKPWANQGVLLLNASLTVEKDKPNSHKNLGWESITDGVIKMISTEFEGVVFLLWGNFAQKKSKLIDASKHLVLQSGHPSPMSANQGKWFGNKHFSKTNAYLIANHKKTIDWQLP